MLPPSVAAALDARLDGLPRADLVASAERFSLAYRSGRGSAEVIRSATDALAYALVRMPATLAAVRHVLGEARRLAPTLAPTTMLDLGAGTGAASLAAQDAWPGLEHVCLIEPNAALAALARDLVARVGVSETHVAADARQLRTDQSVDLALASYMLVELDLAAADRVVQMLLQSARQIVVLVEPGTMAGFERIRAARNVVTAAGWHILAPCPHDGPCPLAGDWCHSYVRVARSRTHRMLKGADAPYEDEPLSYLAATREALSRAPGRILRAPNVEKGQVRLEVCCADGHARPVTVPRRDKAHYKAAKSRDAGDAWDG